MSLEIRVPQLPESVSDATIAAWLKKAGDPVRAEEPLLELETDKVVLEVPAPEDGILSEIRVEQGATVQENDVIAVLTPATQSTQETQDSTVQQEPEPAIESDSSEQAEVDKHAQPVASPAVRKAMHENDVKPEEVHASGEKGRILKQDVEEVVARREHQQEASQSESIKYTGQTKSVADLISTERPERRVPMSRLRQRVAERLVDAQHTAAILTTFNEVDLSDLVRLRKTYQERFQHAHGIKLGFMSFFVKAATEALKRFPEVNARIDGTDIIYHGYYDIGVAVSTDRGLVVPIIRDTDQLGHADIEKAIADYASRAREGKLEMDELMGGTFSISNGGVFGSMLSTPILNPPQSAILGMHKIEKRAVVRNDEIVIRPMMYLALSYDHRIIDGKTAVSFLVKIKDLLEDPASLLLEL